MAALTSAVTKMDQVMTPPSQSHSTTELSGNTSIAASVFPAKLANLLFAANEGFTFLV